MKRITLLLIFTICVILFASPVLAEVQIDELTAEEADELIGITTPDLEEKVIGSFEVVLSIGIAAGLFMIVLGIAKLKKWNRLVDSEIPETKTLANSKKTRFIILIIVGVISALLFASWLSIVVWVSS